MVFFLTLFCFSIFYIFFFVRPTFGFHVQEEICIACGHIIGFFFLLQKDLDTFYRLLFEAICFFLLYLADESYSIFTKNVYIQNCHLRNSSSLFIIVINILRSLHNWVLRIDWKTFEFYLNITWNQFKVHILDTSRELYFLSKILNFFQYIRMGHLRQ